MMTQPATGRAARLEDVAALAGVSTATASKALAQQTPYQRRNQAACTGCRQATQLLSQQTRPIPSPRHHRHYRPGHLRSAGSFLHTDSYRRGERVASPIDLSIVGQRSWRRRLGTSACRETAVPQGRRTAHRAVRDQPQPTLGHDWGVPLSTSTALHRPQRLLGHLRQRGRRPHGHQPSHLVWPPAHRHYRRRRNLYRCHRPHQGSSRGTLRIRY